MSTAAQPKPTAPAKTKVRETITITPPRFQIAEFQITGTSPLVIHRFSAKVKEQMKQKMEMGRAAGGTKKRDPKLTDDLYEEARYRFEDGGDGFTAHSVRCAMIDACRLTGAVMARAKLSVFVLADGYDVHEPQIPLVRIIGKPKKQEDICRVSNPKRDPYLAVRAAYYNWKAKIRIKWDADQMTLQDVTNLLSRVGQQVGLGEGRPNSRSSVGLGWGLFEVEAR
jgi:hypothetical protein